MQTFLSLLLLLIAVTVVFCDGIVIGVDGATMNDDSGRGMSAIPGMSFGKTFMGGISGRSGSGRSVRRLVHMLAEYYGLNSFS